jgi:hypothetical protein
MNYQRIPLTLFLGLLFSCACLQVQAQNLRAATASSYIERGNQWFAKGEYARAEADFSALAARRGGGGKRFRALPGA